MSIIVLCLVIVFSLRFYEVNRNVKTAIVQEFPVGEIVPFGNDFNNSPDENMNGYALQVLSSEIVSVDEFNEKYNPSNEEVVDDLTEYYYLVNVSFENFNKMQDVENGVSLDVISLVGTNYYMTIDYAVFQMINPDMPGTSFSLKPESSKKMILPYAVVPEVHADSNGLRKDPPKLQMTEYPHRKMIDLNEDCQES